MPFPMIMKYQRTFSLALSEMLLIERSYQVTCSSAHGILSTDVPIIVFHIENLNKKKNLSLSFTGSVLRIL